MIVLHSEHLVQLFFNLHDTVHKLNPNTHAKIPEGEKYDSYTSIPIQKRQGCYNLVTTW